MNNKRIPMAAAVLACVLLGTGCEGLPAVRNEPVVRVERAVWPAEADTLEWLRNHSDSIVIARVTAISDPSKTADAAGREIVARTVTLEVSAGLKGPHLAGQSVSVQVPGGTADGVTLKSEDAPEFAAGEEVVVALDETGAAPRVVGGYRGKFTMTPGGPVRDKRVVAEHREVDAEALLTGLSESGVPRP